MSARHWPSLSLSFYGSHPILTMLSGYIGAQKEGQVTPAQARMSTGEVRGSVINSVRSEDLWLNEVNSGDAQDYGELYNQGTEATHLARYDLSADLSNPIKESLGAQLIPRAPHG